MEKPDEPDKDGNYPDGSHVGAHGRCRSATCLSCDCTDRHIAKLRELVRHLVSEIEGHNGCFMTDEGMAAYNEAAEYE